MNSSKILIDVLMILIALLTLGTVGFKYFAKLNWVDAFQTSAFYVTGLGSNTNMPTDSAKIWSALFAILATTLFIGIAVTIIADLFEKRYVNLDDIRNDY